MNYFHYTSVDAVKSMLSNRKLWLTDARFLNDSQELHEGIQSLSDALKRPSHGLFADYSYEEQSLAYLEAAFKDSANFGLAEDPIFVFSLAGAVDLLSQWRGYGRYAIEFKADAPTGVFADLRTCVYENAEKKELAQNAITKALTDISNDMAKNGGHPGMVSLEAVGSLVKLAATFKGKGFYEEREARLVGHASDFATNVLYRARGDYLVPYLEIELDLDCVCAVHVGPVPQQELALTSMRSFVREVEKGWISTTSNIEYELAVKASSIPFRGS